MKSRLSHRFRIVLCWLSLAAPLSTFAVPPKNQAQEESDPPPKMIRVQVEFIDLPHEQLTELMFGDKVAANDGELRMQVAQLVKDGKASIAETMICTCPSGGKATSESFEEFIYPTEYEPAELPNDLHFKDDKEAETAKTTRRDFATGPTPTAFETRNVGSSLEINPTLNEDKKTIRLSFFPSIVYHVGNQIWAEWKGTFGNTPIQMPTFYTIQMNSSATLVSGEYLMTGALSPKTKDGHTDFSRKLMIFVKADVLTAGR